ncbi:MAG: ATP-binding protein [Candidatus Kapabacteria bacterium]|nr:ATP-binding protein [Candidatus Kapabacteria bacterium]
MQKLLNTGYLISLVQIIIKNNMKGLFSKFFIISFVIIAFSILAIILFINGQKLENYSNLISNTLKEHSYSIENFVTPYLLSHDFPAIDSVSKKALTNKNIFVVILSDSDEVIFSSENLDKKELYKLKEKISNVIVLAKNTQSFELSEQISANSVYFRTINSDNKRIGSIFLTNVDKNLMNWQSQLNNNIILGLVVSLLSAFIIALLYTRKVAKSLDKIIQAAEKVASGDFDIKVELSRKDDFFKLASSFNEMTNQIKSLFNQVSMQKDELNSVISTIQEGLLVIDRKDIIVLANDSMKKILNTDKVTGNQYGLFIKNSKLWQLINRTRDKKRSSSCELQIGQEFYLCTADLMETKDEVILIFFNITEAKKLEIVKKDFITNVSHELRTPLTSIRGFIETLMDEIDDEHKQYLNIINNNTKRLISIVEDLLTLSELENKETPLIISDVNLTELIKSITVIFEQKLKEKQISLIHNFQDEVPLIKADAFRLEQLMINLIDNAIKYSQDGTIEVKLYNNSENVFIEVKDSGLGIPKEHQSRIFERFYTVDKSHSRKTGGTGLGLSIVKHIVQAHNGEINLESEVGKGTTFIVKIPIFHTVLNEEVDNNFQSV